MTLINCTEDNIERLTRRAYEVRMLREIDNDMVFQWKWDELDAEEKGMRMEFVKDLIDAINHCSEKGQL